MSNFFVKNITDIFHYDLWANQKLIRNIEAITDEEYQRSISVPFKNVHGLLQHLYYYHEKYFQRIVHQSQSTHQKDEKAEKLDKVEKVENAEIDLKLSRNLLSEKILICSKNWLDWAKNLDDDFLNMGVAGNDFQDNFQNSFQGIIYLFAHNNYHRGQLQIALSILGYQPESIDVYLYKDMMNPSPQSL